MRRRLLDAALDLLWEVQQGAGDTRGTDRVTEAAFADYADRPRFGHVLCAAMDTVRGILLLGLSEPDTALAQAEERMSGAR